VLYRIKDDQKNSTVLCFAPHNVEDGKWERKKQIGAYNAIGNHKKPVDRAV
jgi:hypothetical protein